VRLAPTDALSDDRDHRSGGGRAPAPRIHVRTTPATPRRRLLSAVATTAAAVATGAVGLSAGSAAASGGPEAQAQPRLSGGTCARGWTGPKSYTAKQQLLARRPDGGVPNGVASEPAFSRDSRANRYVAYTSTATDIAVPVTPGRRNVFVAVRTGRVSKNANHWTLGRSDLVSVAPGGVAADGDSWGASISGWSGGRDQARGARLLAFLSTATNLTADGNPGGTGAFIRKVGGGGIARIAVPGAATGVAVSGDSKYVYVSTDLGLFLWHAGKVRRLLTGGGISSPSTTFNGAQAAYERDGVVWTIRRAGGRRRITEGHHPQTDGGDMSTGRRRGLVRSITFTRAGGAYRAETAKAKIRVKRFGNTQAAPASNAGGSAIAFGNGVHACLEVELIDETRRRGGYSIPQGQCPEGQGTVTDVSVSTRYNYLAFSCSGGALFLQYVGPK
jgi:hypothetical protein